MAVTDSTGQHGPWSDQLTVTYDGMYNVCMSIIVLLAVYSAVKFNATLTPSGILVKWQVSYFQG